jgi:hypothetical protein
MSEKKQKSLELSEGILADAFGLEQLYKPTDTLAEWLSATGVLKNSDAELLEEATNKLIKNATTWNEEELKMQFISMLLWLARFSDRYRTYYDREISATIGTHFLLCKADMMLSKGVGELIKTPYFFMHEYKREKKYSGDPVGQMLGGMLIAQAKNNNSKPVYGCYVQGRFWFFAVLEDNKYAISKSFDSSEIAEAKQVIFMLQKLNTIILERLMD